MKAVGLYLPYVNGKRADLRGANLEGANFKGVKNLEEAVNLGLAKYLGTRVTKREKEIIEGALKLFVVESS